MISPAFQFYPKDWLSSAKVSCMTHEIKGAYVTLLCHDWLNDGIPENDEELSMLSGLNEKWQSDSTAIILLKKCFIKHHKKQGFLTNPRLQEEREKQIRWHENKKNAGKKGSDKRWNSNNLNGKAIVLPLAKNAFPVPTLHLPNSSNKESLKKEIAVLDKQKQPELNDDEFINSLKSNIAYQGIDIERELAKMDAWLSIRPAKKKTRRFVVNWLNRIEKPIKTTYEQPRQTGIKYSDRKPNEYAENIQLKKL